MSTPDDRSAGDGPPRQGRGVSRTGRFRSWIVQLALVTGLVLLVWFAGHVFLLAFAGALLAIFLQTLSEWFSRATRLPYRWSLAVVVFLLLGLLAVGVWQTQAQLARQFDQFIQTFPAMLRDLRDRLNEYQWGRWLLQQFGGEGSLLQRLPLSRITGAVWSVVRFGVSVVVILFVGLYGAIEPGFYTRGLVKLVPPERRRRAEEVLHSVGETLRWWLLGQLCSMALVGTLTVLGLWLLNVRLALLLGFLAGFLELIPNLGPVLAAGPAILVALSQSPTKALYVLLLYNGVQFIESYIALPLIQRQAVRVPPALVILAVVLLGILSGILGVFVATPLLVAVMVLVKMVYIEDVLGDWSAEEGR